MILVIFKSVILEKKWGCIWSMQFYFLMYNVTNRMKQKGCKMIYDDTDEIDSS